MNEQKQELINEGISEERLQKLQTQFVSEYQKLYNSYNISISKDEIEHYALQYFYSHILTTIEIKEASTQEAIEQIEKQFENKNTEDLLYIVTGILLSAKENGLGRKPYELYSQL